jgi:hypothetical protein
LEDVENELDLKCKLLEWCSRSACKDMPYHQQWRNDKYNLDNKNRVNQLLGTNFNEEQMLIIYCKIGNKVNHELTIKFINSNYDMNILKGKDTI